MSLGFLATPWFSHQPLAPYKPFAFPCDCNGSNHCTGSSSATPFLSDTLAQSPNNFAEHQSVLIVSPLFAASRGRGEGWHWFVLLADNEFMIFFARSPRLEWVKGRADRKEGSVPSVTSQRADLHKRVSVHIQ